MKRSLAENSCEYNNTPKRVKPNNNDMIIEQIDHSTLVANFEDNRVVLLLDLNFSPPKTFVTKMAVKRQDSKDIETVEKFFDNFLQPLLYQDVARMDLVVIHHLFKRGIDMIKERYEFGRLMYYFFVDNYSEKGFPMNNFINLASVLKLWEYKLFAASMAFKLDRTLQLVPEHIKQEEFIVKIAIQSFKTSMQYVSDNFLTNRRFAMEIVPKNLDLVWYFKLNDDESFLYFLSKLDGSTALEYASYKIKRQRKFGWRVLRNNGYLVNHPQLVNLFSQDRKFIVELAKKRGMLALDLACDEFKKDKEITLVAVSSNGFALEIASDEFRSDREVVMKAISNCGLALEFASDDLRSDRDVVMEAVSENGLALEFASMDLRKERQVVMKAAMQNMGAVVFAPKRMLQNRDVALELIEIHPYSAQDYLPEKFRKDKKFLMQLAKQNGVAALQFASEKMMLDRELVIAAVTNNGNALEFAPKKFKKDKDIVKIADENMCDMSDESDDEDAVEYCDTESDSE